jgi:hypothetical protein
MNANTKTYLISAATALYDDGGKLPGRDGQHGHHSFTEYVKASRIFGKGTA